MCVQDLEEHKAKILCADLPSFVIRAAMGTAPGSRQHKPRRRPPKKAQQGRKQPVGTENPEANGVQAVAAPTAP